MSRLSQFHPKTLTIHYFLKIHLMSAPFRNPKFQLQALSPNPTPSKPSNPLIQKFPCVSSYPTVTGVSVLLLLTTMHYILIYTLGQLPVMQRRTPLCCTNAAYNTPRTQKKCPSSETVDSDAGSNDPRTDKIKSQLCKKFMENGYCPYGRKCKFAHGSQELRKNDQVNSKYKTKECGSFTTDLVCMYGDRCNFIHHKSHTPHTLKKSEWQAGEIDLEMRLIRMVSSQDSRLLRMLQ